MQGKVIRSILVNWNELQAYFMEVEKHSAQDVRMKVRIILNHLGNPFVPFHFIFSEPTVADVERINQLFQSERLDLGKALSELQVHYK